jgi:FkbM family methyltransferase
MKTIVEIGANTGTDTIKYAKEGILYTIEPVPVLAEKLKETFSDNTNVNVFQMAISDYNGFAKFGISDPNFGAANMGCSSLNDFSDDIHQKWGGRGDFNMIEYVDVKVMRMDSFIEQQGITEIDYLHCDAQGSDLKVLQSFGDKISILKAGKCEAANTVDLYKGVDNSIYSIIKFLEENGFKIIELNNNFHQQISVSDLPNSTEEVDIHFERI